MAFLIDGLILVLFPAVMAFAATSDLVSMTISNTLQLILIIGFFILAGLLGFGWETILYHSLAFLAALLITFLFFAMGWMGGGDAKLVACTALWYAPSLALMDYMMLSAIFGGILTIVLLYARTLVLPSSLSSQSWILRLHNEKTGIPYGIALSAAALLTYPETKIFTHSLL